MDTASVNAIKQNKFYRLIVAIQYNTRQIHKQTDRHNEKVTTYYCYSIIGERDTLRGNTIENRGCLFIYMCGHTYVILYFDPHIFVFASWSTPSHTSTKQNLFV